MKLLAYRYALLTVWQFIALLGVLMIFLSIFVNIALSNHNHIMQEKVRTVIQHDVHTVYKDRQVTVTNAGVTAGEEMTAAKQMCSNGVKDFDTDPKTGRPHIVCN